MATPATFFTYFPQFTPDPINDHAWYPGFTDWDLVRKLPSDQIAKFMPKGGTYDTADPAYLRRLVEQTSNLNGNPVGLMVYHYHFDGRSVLGKFEQNLIDAETTPPFFICWANETWSKRWVGKAGEIIIEQQHKIDRKTIAAHALHLSKLFAREEYLKIDGRPLWMIYNPLAAPTLPECLGIYRECFKELGFEPIIGCCLPHIVDPDFVDPFDMVAEFQPRFYFGSLVNDNLIRFGSRLKAAAPQVVEMIGGLRDRFRPSRGSKCYDYADYLASVENGSMEKMLREIAGGRPVIRCAFFSWNNQPRYADRNTMVQHDGLKPGQLNALKQIRSDPGLPLLVNSWNEWSEGAALEPGEQEHPLRQMFLDAVLER